MSKDIRPPSRGSKIPAQLLTNKPGIGRHLVMTGFGNESDTPTLAKRYPNLTVAESPAPNAAAANPE